MLCCDADLRSADPQLPRLALQTIGVWGDIGHTPNSTDTRNHLLANNPAIVYNTADFVYAGTPAVLLRHLADPACQLTSCKSEVGSMRPCPRPCPAEFAS